jgi:hypothetical protein
MTKDEAIARARAFAESQGWTWREPVHAETYRPWFVGAPRWRIVTNYGLRGGNVRIELDDATGNIIKSQYVPR